MIQYTFHKLCMKMKLHAELIFIWKVSPDLDSFETEAQENSEMAYWTGATCFAWEGSKTNSHRRHFSSSLFNVSRTWVGERNMCVPADRNWTHDLPGQLK